MFNVFVCQAMVEYFSWISDYFSVCALICIDAEGTQLPQTQAPLNIAFVVVRNSQILQSRIGQTCTWNAVNLP